MHIEFAASCMGHEIPAGLGYALARPDAEGAVFVLIGDGTYLMQPTELVTAAQEGAKVITVVVDNSGHQCIRGLQVQMTDVEFGTQLRARDAATGRLTGRVVEVDFAANARSLGCAAWHVETLEEFEAAIAAARAVDGPSVIVVPVEPFRGLSENECFWDVGVAETSERPEIRERSDAHLAGRQAVRFYPASTAPVGD